MTELTLDTFAGAVGEPFSVDAGADGVELILAEASDLPHSMRSGGGFRLEFSGPANPLLPQAIYTMRRGGEAHDIFIVPIARTAEASRYEAVFF
jgi:hypothetical protein